MERDSPSDSEDDSNDDYFPKEKRRKLNKDDENEAVSSLQLDAQKQLPVISTQFASSNNISTIQNSNINLPQLWNNIKLHSEDINRVANFVVENINNSSNSSNNQQQIISLRQNIIGLINNTCLLGFRDEIYSDIIQLFGNILNQPHPIQEHQQQQLLSNISNNFVGMSPINTTTTTTTSTSQPPNILFDFPKSTSSFLPSSAGSTLSGGVSNTTIRGGGVNNTSQSFQHHSSSISTTSSTAESTTTTTKPYVKPPITRATRVRNVKSKSSDGGDAPAKKMTSGFCKVCGKTESVEWRKGPDNQKSLCNACGLHYAKLLKSEKQSQARKSEKIKVSDLLNPSQEDTTKTPEERQQEILDQIRRDLYETTTTTTEKGIGGGSKKIKKTGAGASKKKSSSSSSSSTAITTTTTTTTTTSSSGSSGINTGASSETRYPSPRMQRKLTSIKAKTAAAVAAQQQSSTTPDYHPLERSYSPEPMMVVSPTSQQGDISSDGDSVDSGGSSIGAAATTTTTTTQTTNIYQPQPTIPYGIDISRTGGVSGGEGIINTNLPLPSGRRTTDLPPPRRSITPTPPVTSTTPPPVALPISSSNITNIQSGFENIIKNEHEEQQNSKQEK